MRFIKITYFLIMLFGEFSTLVLVSCYETSLIPSFKFKCQEIQGIISLLYAGKACIKKVLLSNCLQELMELHQVASYHPLPYR